MLRCASTRRLAASDWSNFTIWNLKTGIAWIKFGALNIFPFGAINIVGILTLLSDLWCLQQQVYRQCIFQAIVHRCCGVVILHLVCNHHLKRASTKINGYLRSWDMCVRLLMQLIIDLLLYSLGDCSCLVYGKFGQLALLLREIISFRPW